MGGFVLQAMCLSTHFAVAGADPACSSWLSLAELQLLMGPPDWEKLSCASKVAVARPV